MRAQKGAVEAARDGLKPGGVFYYADESGISRHPTLRAMWSPKGRQVMVPTPARPIRRHGLGAVGWHGGEAVALTRKRKRRREVAELLEALLAKHPHQRAIVAWDNAGTHEDAEVEAVLRGAAGRLVLFYLPTYSPWLNPVEMLWRHHRREVAHCELFESVDALLGAAREFFDRVNRAPGRARSIIGAHPS